jgi:hypothetical protein
MPDHPPITVLAPLVLLPFVALDGARPRRAAMGMWTAYIPATGLKVHHAVGGRLHCLSRVAPRREDAAAVGPNGEGRRAQWARAFATRATRRAAENWVMLRRLHAAGIGPEPLGLAVLPRYRSWFTHGWTVSAGTFVANLNAYPPKAPTTEEELRAAGIVPDGGRATLREQINGYVSDINSLQGAMPLDAEEEVAEIAAALDAALLANGGGRA